MTAGRMRVLHLCAANVYGGVERIVAECASARALCGAMDPSFAVCFDGRLAEEIEASGARCASLGAVKVSLPHTVFRARRQLARVIDTEKPHAVICHSSWIHGLAAPIVRSARVTLVLWIHDRISGRTWPERWARMTAPDLIITNSRFTDESVAAVYPQIPRRVMYAPVPA